MSSVDIAVLAPNDTGPTARKVGLIGAIKDGLVMTERNLIATIRIPEAIFFLSIQPVMFVLLFRYVFGGAIKVPGGAYVDYLIPGIFVQTVAFGGAATAVGLAEDLQKGLIERFRSLPMARSAVLFGRTVADLIRNLIVLLIITGVGYLTGFRVHTSLLEFIAAIGVMLLFSFALSWAFAYIGLSAPNSETAQLMTFPILFPLTFASSAFVPVSSMPSWLQGFASHQPVSVVVDSVRALSEGGPIASNVEQAIAWSIFLLVFLGAVSVRKYRKLA